MLWWGFEPHNNTTELSFFDNVFKIELIAMFSIAWENGCFLVFFYPPLSPYP